MSQVIIEDLDPIALEKLKKQADKHGRSLQGELKYILESAVLEETETPSIRRTVAASIAGKGKTLGDLIKPIVDEQDWECLK